MKKNQFVKLFAAIALGVFFGMTASDRAIGAANWIQNAFGGFIRFLVPFIIAGFITSSIAKV